ncbi:MAG: nuclear transport factor 2 family protein [Hyphomicrobiaceae bacterium]
MSTQAETATMAPSPEDRDVVFKTFGRAWFRRDVELLYQAVTPDFVWASFDGHGQVRQITGRDAVAAEFAAMGGGNIQRRFEDVVYHHAPDCSFMTFRVVATDKTTGQSHETVGVERYVFRDGRIAVKDVYVKPVG